MADPFVGELRLVGFTFAPLGWQLAQGQILSINQNAPLFSLFGTMYGGDGRTNFGLPNLQGSAAIGVGQGPGLQPYTQGQIGGVPNVSLNSTTVPPHSHNLQVSTSPADLPSPASNSFGDARAAGGNIYTATPTPIVPMSPAAVSTVGGNKPHNNLMPYLTLNWIVSMTGIFPARP